MPPLDNPRHEKFAQEMAKGNSAAAAYQLAGYDADEKSAETAGPRLFRNVQVQSRVAELQQRGATRAEITLETLIDDAERIQHGAEAAEQWSAANSALQTKAKLSGKWIDRSVSEITGKDGGPITVEDVSARELITSRIAGIATRGTTQGNPGKPH